MPSLGKILTIQTHSGQAFKFGDPWQNLPGDTAPYDGRFVGLWYVPETEFEPEHFDMLAIPAVFWDAFMAIARGADADATMKGLDAIAKKFLAERKSPPSAMRRQIMVKASPVAFFDSSLSMVEAAEHLSSRNMIAEGAYEQDDDDDEDDDGATPPAAAPGQAPPPGWAALP